MNRRSILNISAMTLLALALVPSSAVAQQETLKQQLIGTWTVVSYEATAANGTKRQIVNPKGFLIVTAQLLAGHAGRRDAIRLCGSWARAWMTFQPCFLAVEMKE